MRALRKRLNMFVYTDAKGETIRVLERVQKFWMVTDSLDLVSKIKIFITNILNLR